MVTNGQLALALDSDGGTNSRKPKAGSKESYEQIEEETGGACLGIINDIVDEAGVTKSLPEFTASPFGMALEAAITKRYEELKVEWPDIQQEEILAKAKRLAGKIASHRRNCAGARKKRTSAFRAPWLSRAKRN